MGLALMGVFVASFAGTTLDTSTRLQRYVVAELARGVNLKPLMNRHAATLVAVLTAAALAFPKGGKAGLVLWPLFGAVNQLLACLALLVATVYLKRRGRPLAFTLLPMLFMLVLTGWAMKDNLSGYLKTPAQQWHLIAIGSAIMILEAWMVIEALVVLFGMKREQAGDDTALKAA
jgi:carbon starvation protein